MGHWTLPEDFQLTRKRVQNITREQHDVVLAFSLYLALLNVLAADVTGPENTSFAYFSLQMAVNVGIKFVVFFYNVQRKVECARLA